MGPRRYLFIPAPRRARPWPIYIALVCLVLAAATGLASALWATRPEPAPAAATARGGEAGAPKGDEAIDRVTRPGPDRRPTGRWM